MFRCPCPRCNGNDEPNDTEETMTDPYQWKSQAARAAAATADRRGYTGDTDGDRRARLAFIAGYLDGECAQHETPPVECRCGGAAGGWYESEGYMHACPKCQPVAAANLRGYGLKADQ